MESSLRNPLLLRYSSSCSITCGIVLHLHVKALIDSGAEGNFLDHKTALQLEFLWFPLNSPIFVSALCGQSLPPVTHVTESVSLITSGNHTETISFLLTDSPLAPVVLGHPWLSRQQSQHKLAPEHCFFLE